MLISTIMLMTACKKDSSSSKSTTDNNGNASSLSANGATSDNAYDDAFNIGVQTGYDKNLDNIIGQKSGSTTLGYKFCATVTVSGTSFPVTVTVDFGAGCSTSADGIARSGSITYIFTGKLSTPGTTISATFNNYVVNGYKLAGTYSIKNTSTGAALSLTSAVTGGNITYPNDTSYSFSGTKVATLLIPPSNILDPTSFVFNITGGYTISNTVTGETLTANVTTALERKQSCAHVDKGIVSFKYTKGTASLNGTLDYGDGTCDDSALITIGAFTKTVTLP
jgi:hypothetical protein